MGGKSTKGLKKLEADIEQKFRKYGNYDKEGKEFKDEKKETNKIKATFSEKLKQNGSQCSPLPG